MCATNIMSSRRVVTRLDKPVSYQEPWLEDYTNPSIIKSDINLRLAAKNSTRALMRVGEGPVQPGLSVPVVWAKIVLNLAKWMSKVAGVNEPGLYLTDVTKDVYLSKILIHVLRGRTSSWMKFRIKVDDITLENPKVEMTITDYPHKKSGKKKGETFKFTQSLDDFLTDLKIEKTEERERHTKFSLQNLLYTQRTESATGPLPVIYQIDLLENQMVFKTETQVYDYRSDTYFYKKTGTIYEALRRADEFKELETDLTKSHVRTAMREYLKKRNPYEFVDLIKKQEPGKEFPFMRLQPKLKINTTSGGIARSLTGIKQPKNYQPSQRDIAAGFDFLL